MTSLNIGKKVLYLCGGRSFSNTNPNRKLLEVAKCWRNAGHDVLHIHGGDITANCNSIKNIDVSSYGSQGLYSPFYKKIGILKPIITSLSEWRDLAHDRHLLSHLKEISNEWCPDIVWERSCRLHYAGLQYAKSIGVPYVLEWKDHLVDYRRSLFRYKALKIEDKKIREADFIVVESGILQEKLGENVIDVNKIIVAHNAVKADQFIRDKQKRSLIRERIGIDDKTVLVGYLGSYAFYHNSALLILAADIIYKKQVDTKIRILMVGAGKEYIKTRNLAEKLGLLDEFVIMRPGVPNHEVPWILSALDIAVLPGSTDIICPIKVQEYMASELPSVIPDYACNREVVDDGRTGMLFRPGDKNDLAEKILELAQNADMRQLIGLEARLDAKGRFSWENTWAAALHNVLKRAFT